MSKGKELVKSIGDKLIDKLFELEHEYDYEADEHGFEWASYSVFINYEYGNSQCDVECIVFWKSRSNATIECLVYGCEGIHENRFKNLECIEKAVQEYVENTLDTDDLLDAMEEDLREANMDEWECHGFRDAADYYSWRYG